LLTSSPITFRTWHRKGIQTQAASRAIPGLGVAFSNADPVDSPTMAALRWVFSGEPEIKARWFQGGWFDAVSALWREVSTGQFQANVGWRTAARTPAAVDRSW
jgi:hypothetical protein